MGEAKEGGIGEIEPLSMHINGRPRDLLQRFMAGNHRRTEFTATSEEDTEEIELNLGLSLGGRFGVDPKKSRIVRSSSIAGLTTFLRDDDALNPPPVSCLVITRTCSLPTETEEEIKKRKELQSLRRMEAKRKRSEKRNFRACKDRTSSLERNWEEEKRTDDEDLMVMSVKGKIEGIVKPEYNVTNGLNNSAVSGFGNPNWARGIDLGTNGKSNFLPATSSKGSLGSQGSSSSGISDFESKPVIQGSSSGGEARSPASVQSLPELIDQKSVSTTTVTTTENASKFPRVPPENGSKMAKVIEVEVKETGRDMIKEMPCVSTKGNGPNGRRIEGFLYKYRKGEEVRIVCVCHGSFLSPAEFVKHAGGGDVEHPLRHIVVNPSSFL